MPLPDHLVAGKTRGKVVAQRRFSQRTTLSRDDESVGDLAGVRVGHADDAAVGDVGMFEQRRLELSWRDAEGPALDHLLLAVDDVGVALGVDRPDVARVQPTVTQRPRGFLRRVPIALHQLWAADDDFSGLAGPEDRFTRFEIDDAL